MKNIQDVNPVDNRVLQLASEVSAAEDEDLPELLLRIKDIIDTSYENGNTRNASLESLWVHELPQVLLFALKQNFAELPGSWRLAGRLMAILSSFSMIFQPNDPKVFLKEFMPSVVDINLELIHNALESINSAQEADAKQTVLGTVSMLVTSLSDLVKRFQQFTIAAANSKHLLYFLMLEDEQFSLLAISLLKNLILINRNLLIEISEHRVNNIAEELIFKIASAKDADVASRSMNTIVLMTEVHTKLTGLLQSKRCRSLKAYVNKWKGKGFDDIILSLLKVLDVKSPEEIAKLRLENAAMSIQCMYRGYQTRRRLRRAATSIARFQTIYRARRKRIETEHAERREETGEREREEMARRKGFLRSRQMQLNVVGALPASAAQTFYKDLEEDSATKLQAAWRGKRARDVHRSQVDSLIMIKAATRVQRWFRKWRLLREQRKREKLIGLLPNGLTDERRCQLQEVIGKIREKFPAQNLSDEQLRTNHEKSMSMLNSHMMTLWKSRRADEHRKALLAQLSVQTDTLERLPRSLDQISSTDIENLSSRSTLIAVVAATEHSQALRSFERPWWRRLDGCSERLEPESEIESEKQF